MQSSVTRKTTLLVLGSQDEKRLRKGHRRSLKHDAVKKRIKEGQNIMILRQEEFYELIDCPVQLSLLDLIAQSAQKKRRASLEKKTASKKRSETSKSGIQPRLLA